MAKTANAEPLPPEVETALERLRSEHRLRALTAEESGSGVDRLPAGVYGFTYSPCEDNFPLFDRRDVRCYETHKLGSGEVVLLGFLTSSEHEAWEKLEDRTTLHLFAEPKGEATHLVRISRNRVVRHVEASQRKGTGLEISVSS